MAIDNNNRGHGKEESINIREIIDKYVKKWYWFIFSVILALLLAFSYLKIAQTQYDVHTSILLRTTDNSASTQKAMMQSFGLPGMSHEIVDEIEVIKSKKLLKDVIDTLHLQKEYYLRDGLKYDELYNNLPFVVELEPGVLEKLEIPVILTISEKSGKYIVRFEQLRKKAKYTLSNIQEPFITPIGKIKIITNSSIPPKSKFKVNIHPIRVIVESYAKRINVSAASKQSNVINISIIASNIQKAETLLNKLVDQYNYDAIEDKNLIAMNTAKFLQDRMILIKQELFNVEANVENYKKSNSITDISSEAELYLKSSNEYEKKISDIETQLKLVNDVESYIKDNRNQYNLIPTNIGFEDQALVKVIQTYNEAILERMKLSRSTNAENPAMIQLEQQIKALRYNVLASISSVRDGFRIALNDVTRKQGQFTSRIKNVPTQERQFLEIKRQQEIKQNLYNFLLQKIEENALTLASTAPAARTIDRAYASLNPVAPKRIIILGLAFLLGLAIPFLIIYLRDLINNKIEDVKEFEKSLKAPYLGNVAISREKERVVVAEGKTKPIVEMFRLIRTNLQFMTASKKSPVILVTSTISGEGKSFVSINIAMSFALLKKKTIAIGLDIRNPMLGEYLHIPKDKGITLYLSDNSYNADDIIVHSGFHQYLDVIPAGMIPPNPAELLMSPRLDELILELKNRYDYIIIDTAPIGVVSDTFLLNRIADNFVYVARKDYTQKDAVNLINDVYDNKQLNDMGVVLNGTAPLSSYGYGYGYSSDFRRKYYKRTQPKLTFGEKINDFLYRVFKMKN